MNKFILSFCFLLSFVNADQELLVAPIQGSDEEQVLTKMAENPRWKIFLEEHQPLTMQDHKKSLIEMGKKITHSEVRRNLVFLSEKQDVMQWVIDQLGPSLGVNPEEMNAFARAFAETAAEEIQSPYLITRQLIVRYVPQ